MLEQMIKHPKFNDVVGVLLKKPNNVKAMADCFAKEISFEDTFNRGMQRSQDNDYEKKRQSKSGNKK